MFKHQEEEEERTQSPIKKRRMETRRYPRILLDHEQVPHSLDLRNRAGGVENIKISSLEINFTAVSAVYSGRGKFMPLPLKSKILETPGSLVTDDTKMFTL
jgi:hypothetical protein